MIILRGMLSATLLLAWLIGVRNARSGGGTARHEQGSEAIAYIRSDSLLTAICERGTVRKILDLRLPGANGPPA